MFDRKESLLKAVYDIFKQCDDSPIVLDVLGVKTTQDGIEFDGWSLMEDIRIELGMEE